MVVSAITPQTNVGYKLCNNESNPTVPPQVPSFKGELVTNSKASDDASTAKTFAILGTIISTATLAVTGVMLKKASNLQKAAKPLVEMGEKISAVAKKGSDFLQSTGLDKYIDQVKNEGKNGFDFLSKLVSDIKPTIEKISKTDAADELTKLNEELETKIKTAITSARKKQNEASEKGAEAVKDTFVGHVGTAVSSDKIKFVKDYIDKLEGQFKDALERIGAAAKKVLKKAGLDDVADAEKATEDVAEDVAADAEKTAENVAGGVEQAAEKAAENGAEKL